MRARLLRTLVGLVLLLASVAMMEGVARVLYARLTTVPGRWAVGLALSTTFLRSDGRGQKLPLYFRQLQSVLDTDKAAAKAELQSLIRDVPKPVICRVPGYAIGGGNVLATICDITIASDKAIFGQVGPRMGSVDPGFGTAYLARVVGEKRAREIWFRCRQYDAATAERWGLVNQVVPLERLRDEVRAWADDMLALSPTALRFLKQSFNADTEHIAGIAQLSFSGLGLYLETDEANEGVRAFSEKRPPEYGAYREQASS